MKRYVRIIAYVLGVFLILWIGVNQFDQAERPLAFGGEGVLSEEDYRPGNGYFTLWTLIEPRDRDVHAPEVLAPYRALHREETFARAMAAFDWKRYKKLGGAFARTYQEVQKQYPQWVKSPSRWSGIEWVEWIRRARKGIIALEGEFDYMLARYEDMLRNPFFRDLTIVRSDAPVPNLLAWLRLAKLYSAGRVLEALDGDWDTAVSGLLDQLASARKVSRGSRTLITNLVAKAEFRQAVEALAALMNQPECPRRIYSMILERTPPLEFAEYGSLPLIYEYRYQPDYNWNRFYRLEDKNLVSSALHTLFTLPQHTRNLRAQAIEEIIRAERLEPYKWEKDPFAPRDFTRGAFWWLRNPGGKLLMDRFFTEGGAGLASVIMKSYRARTAFELLRISAELHLEYTPEKGVENTLKGLRTYKVMDPCSGGPYIWNGEKQVLYSIGTDRLDDGGRPQFKDFTGDFPLQVVLYVR